MACAKVCRVLLRTQPRKSSFSPRIFGDLWRGSSNHRRFGTTSSMLSPHNLGEAKLNVMIWEQAELEDYNLTVKDLLDVDELIGKDKKKNEEVLIASAKFLRIHLPPKIARRIKELESLPFPFQKEGGSFQEICSLYKESFLTVLDSKEPSNLEEEAKFSEMIFKMKQNHLTVRQMVGEAMSNMRCTGSGEWVDASGKLVYVDGQLKDRGSEKDVKSQKDYKVQIILRSFYAGRIGVRTMVDQHLALRSYVLGHLLPGEEQDAVRIIWSKIREMEGIAHWPNKTVLHKSLNPKVLVEMAIANAKTAYSELLEESGPRQLNVLIEGHLNEIRSFVPVHLYYIVYEVVSNAILATVRFSSSGELPPVIITIGNGPGICIKCSDRGGGMRAKLEENIWKFTYSKRSEKVKEVVGAKQGLALSRLYARMWDGDIKVLNLEGVGCDVLIQMPEKVFSEEDMGRSRVSFPMIPSQGV